MAIILNPRLLIADEPTTALDVTIQAQILRLMKRLQRDNGMAIMFITHDLGVIANMADDVAVMYLGKIVEYGSLHQIFNDPKHPYTKGLLRSIPKFGETEGKHLATIQGHCAGAVGSAGRLPICQSLWRIYRRQVRSPDARRNHGGARA